MLAGWCYLGLPAEHLELGADDHARLSSDPEGRRRWQTVDGLFRSAARHAGPRVIGVVLSGMLSDGSEGMAAIGRAGGTTMVQLPAEAQFSGMPQAAIDRGTAIDLMAPTAELARGIVHRVLQAGIGCCADPPQAGNGRHEQG